MKTIKKTKKNMICSMSLVFIFGMLLLGGCDRKDDQAKNTTTNQSAVTAETSDNDNETEAVLTPTPAVTKSPDNTEVQEVTATPAPQIEDNITYSNTEYGFDFTLPASWEGYTIQSEDWQGTALEGENQGKVVETGKKLMIRHPEWTEDNPRQDIPILIFTLDQWDRVSKDEIAVSAAPVGPTELGRNTNYVFALPARYNFAFPTGYEEVDQILQGGALKATENFK
jgi:hypothetical protein